MNAKEYLESKGLNHEMEYTHIPTAELALLLDEYHLHASEQKIEAETVKSPSEPSARETKDLIMNELKNIQSALEKKVDEKFEAYINKIEAEKKETPLKHRSKN